MEDYFDVVDEDDNIIGRATREDCHTTGKIHRGVHIFIFNSKGELLLGQRSMNKDLYPGWWGDIAGHINVGESYEDAAKRELKEETGITCRLKKLFSFKKRYKADNENLTVYTCKYDGKIVLNPEEFISSKFYDVKLLKDDIDGGRIKLTPGTESAFKALYGQQLRLKK